MNTTEETQIEKKIRKPDEPVTEKRSMAELEANQHATAQKEAEQIATQHTIAQQKVIVLRNRNSKEVLAKASQFNALKTSNEHPENSADVNVTTARTYYDRVIKGKDLEQLVAAELTDSCGDITRVIGYYARAAELGNGDAAFQLAQFYRIDHIGMKKDLNQAVDYYMKAAKFGHQEALIPLETLCEEMIGQKKLALSHFYGSIFNREKAAIWHQKSTETEQLNLLM